MNAFEKVLASLSDESTNAVVALLTYASTDYEGADTYTNPVDETMRRLAARGVNDIGMSVILPRLNTLREAYQSGSIR